MKRKRFLDITITICLFVPALIFVENYIVEYLKGETLFVETQEPISLKDVPTVTYCAGWPHLILRRSGRIPRQWIPPELRRIGAQIFTDVEKNKINNGSLFDEFWINIRFDGHTYHLTPNNTIQHQGLEMKLERFFPYPRTPPFSEHCFRLVPNTIGSGGDYEITRSNFSFLITFSFPVPAPFSHFITFTTEENSYGITQNQWFDGRVDVIQFDSFKWATTALKIEDITEYRYLKTSKTRFYNLPAATE